MTPFLTNNSLRPGTKGLKRSAFKRVPGTARRLKTRGPSTADLKWAKAVRQRDGYTCRWPGCGYYSLSIHAHHIHSRKQRPDLRHDLANGTSLCPKHHDELHHTVEGRQQGRELGLLGTDTYEKARKDQP